MLKRYLFALLIGLCAGKISAAASYLKSSEAVLSEEQKIALKAICLLVAVSSEARKASGITATDMKALFETAREAAGVPVCMPEKPRDYGYIKPVMKEHNTIIIDAWFFFMENIVNNIVIEKPIPGQTFSVCMNSFMECLEANYAAQGRYICDENQEWRFEAALKAALSPCRLGAPDRPLSPSPRV